MTSDNEWKSQLAARLTTLQEICRAAGLPCPPQDAQAVQAARLPVYTTPYYASLIREASFSDPVYAMTVPQAQENLRTVPDCDPLLEEKYMPVPGLIRRYPDRAVYTASHCCAAQCRHCTRRWQIMERKGLPWRQTLPGVLDFLKDNPQVQEIIVSGGDPLTLEDAELDTILSALKGAGVKLLRLGTRMPVTCPMRVTEKLAALLARYNPIWIQTHFNHPAEVTPESARALKALADAGLPINNQTVLLRGVNDSADTLEELFRLLVRNRVRPYYLFQCDRIPGTEHFWTPLSLGVKIMQELRDRLSGIAIPVFIVDRPALEGKVPLSFATAEKDDSGIRFL